MNFGKRNDRNGRLQGVQCLPGLPAGENAGAVGKNLTFAEPCDLLSPVLTPRVFHMSVLPSELMQLDRFLDATPERRDAIGREVAASLGDGWAAEGLVGDKQLCSVRHTPLDLVFVVVPGGEFEMGYRDDDREAAGRVMDLEDPFVAEFLEACEKDARPVRTVAVRPHLFGQKLLERAEIDRIDPARGTDEVDREAALALAATAGLRLPSEAEYEWVAREGGGLSFTCDVASRFDGDALNASALVNGFGVAELPSPQWMADDPHDSYEGAPATSAAWRDDGGTPASLEAIRRGEDGVRRGMAEDYLESPPDLLYCLAALRHGGDLIRLRLCRDLG